jgi:hypothetical protein
MGFIPPQPPPKRQSGHTSDKILIMDKMDKFFMVCLVIMGLGVMAILYAAAS